MRPLSLDYRRSNRSLHWTGIAVLTAALIVLSAVVYHYTTVAAEVTHLEKLVDRIERKLRPGRMVVPVTAAEAQQQAVEVKTANDVLHRLSLPWGALFEAVEAANNDNIALLGIEPDARARRLQISGEAKDFDELLGYIRTLQGDEFLSGVYLEHHQVEEKVAEHPIRFTLGASWTDRR